MTHHKVAFATLVLILCLFSSIGSFTYGITGNYQADTTHTSAALVVFYKIGADGQKIPVASASGVLISPSIVLTAAHAVYAARASVIFDNGPISWIQQPDGSIQTQNVKQQYDGSAIVHPAFSVNMAKKGSDEMFSHDVAAIVLDTPVQGIQPATLPEEGFDDTLPENTAVELVGYGMQEQVKSGGQKTWIGLLMRNMAYAKIMPKTGNEFLRISANDGNGRGGITYGDSGGPVFLAGTNILLAVHSYIKNSNAAGQTYHARVDTSDVLNWISEVS